MRGAPALPASVQACRIRWTIGATWSGGAPPTVQPSPYSMVRRTAAAPLPPISSGTRPPGTTGTTGSVLPSIGSPRQAAVIVSSI